MDTTLTKSTHVNIETQGPRISVLMPVYNVEQYVAEAIESILDQTFKDFELIIVDDASADRTVDVVQRYQDPRIRLIRKPSNTGYVDSLNRALDLATGEFIARMDGDDISLNIRFERQVRYLEENAEVSVVGSWFETIPGKEVLKPHVSPDECKVWLLRKSVLAHPTVMIRKAALVKHGLRYQQHALYSEDYRLWVDAEKAGLQIANCPEVLFRYREHNTQVSKVHAVKQSDAFLAARLDYWIYCFPASMPGNEHVIDQILSWNFNSHEMYMAARRLARSIVRENKHSGKVNHRILRHFLHMNLAHGAANLYNQMRPTTLLRGLVDRYFYMAVISRLIR